MLPDGHNWMVINVISGLLQFQTTPVPVGMIRPALEEAHVTVQEEAGVVSLLVARAQGLLGRVMVGYRTSPLTAAGSEDYEVPTVAEHLFGGLNVLSLSQIYGQFVCLLSLSFIYKKKKNFKPSIYKILKNKCITVSTKIFSSTTVFNIDNNNKCFLSTKSAHLMIS